MLICISNSVYRGSSIYHQYKKKRLTDTTEAIFMQNTVGLHTTQPADCNQIP